MDQSLLSEGFDPGHINVSSHRPIRVRHNIPFEGSVYVVTRFRRNSPFDNVIQKTVLKDVNPRLPYLRPRESGDVVTELSRLNNLVTDTWLHSGVHIITQSSKDVNAWHTRIQDVLANSKEDISQYLTIVTTRGEPVLLPGKL